MRNFKTSSFLLPVFKEKTGQLVRLLDEDNREKRRWREEGWVHKDQLSQYNMDLGLDMGRGLGEARIKSGISRCKPAYRRSVNNKVLLY